MKLVEKMIGKDLEDLSVIKKHAPPTGGASVNYYEAENLSSSESRPFDFHIARGEVNGFTGLLCQAEGPGLRAGRVELHRSHRGSLDALQVPQRRY